MNKLRLEAMSDGVFAIAMTLLVFQVHVPTIADGAYSVLGLWNALIDILPLIISYVVSFTVIAMYWTSHHAMFHFFTKSVNRTLVQINMLYLMLLAFVPFSTQLLGTYSTNILALWVYGLNIIALGGAAYGMFMYAIHSKDVDMHDVPNRTITQAKIRLMLTPAFALLAMFAAFISSGFAFLLFVFPVIFNLIPGSLDRAERFLGITIK